jgi:hypothetical protein
MEMDNMKQMIQELLGGIQERMNASMEKFEEKLDYHKNRMAMLDAHHKSIMASLGQTDANTENTVPDTEMMQSAVKYQDIPNEVVTVVQVRGLRKGVGEGS